MGLVERPSDAPGFGSADRRTGPRTDRSVQRLDDAALIAAGNSHVADPAQVFDILADAPRPLIDVLGSRYSPVTPRGLSGGYYYARVNYLWGR